MRNEPNRQQHHLFGQAGSLLMQCPVCHRREYISEHRVYTRQEACHCRWCGDSHALLEPMQNDASAESPADRLRPPFPR